MISILAGFAITLTVCKARELPRAIQHHPVISGLLLLFVAGQCIVFFSHQFFFGSIVLLAVVTGYGGISFYKYQREYEITTHLRHLTLLIASANAAVFLVYVPLLWLNPRINWSLSGTTSEVDPGLVISFFPILQLTLSGCFLAICSAVRRAIFEITSR